MSNKSEGSKTKKHATWVDKNVALNTKNIRLLRRLSRHNDEFVRLAVTLNRALSENSRKKTKDCYKNILVGMIRTDPVISIRDSALAKLLKLG